MIVRPYSLLACLLLASACPSSLLAQTSGVITRDYVENEVVDLAARPGFQATIRFDAGERVENIAIGESGGWQVTPNRRADLIFLKPAATDAPLTNMTVVTDRHTYLFRLRVAAKGEPMLLMRFTYPDSAWQTDASETEPRAELIPAVMRDTLPVAQLNFAWSMKGARKLFPARSFDDGHSVYLAWEEGRALPAVLATGPDGKSEGPVNFTASEGYLIVEGFYNRLVLRSGKDSAILETGRTAPDQAAMTAKTE